MNIIIAGMTCSGKSTLSEIISSEYGATVIQEDFYFKNRENIPIYQGYYLMDSPNAFYLEEFYKDVWQLLENGFVMVPRYDVKTNRRVAKNIKLEKSEINVFEGLHTIDTLSELENSVRVFIDTPISECLRRRINRDIKYGIQKAKVEEYFREIIIKMYELYIKKQRNQADIVMEGIGDKKCLLKKLQKYF